MNKIIISIGVLVIAIFGWLAFQENTVYYVATIDNEVTELEDELVKIDAEVQAGTLSPEAATVARVSIVTRLEKINTAVAESKSKELTPEQQKMLVDGLNRLKEILVKYKTTLTVVENTATVKTDITSSNGRRHTSITAVLNETIDTVEENVIVQFSVLEFLQQKFEHDNGVMKMLLKKLKRYSIHNATLQNNLK